MSDARGEAVPVVGANVPALRFGLDRHFTKTIVLVCLLAAPLVVASRAGGAVRPSPVAWLSVYCGSTLSWKQAVRSDTAKLEQEIKLINSANVGKVRAEFLSYLGTVANATTTVSNKLKAAGTPSLANGAAIEQIVTVAFGKLSGEFTAAAKKAHSFSYGPTVLSAQAAALADTIHTDETNLGTAIQGLSKYSTPAFTAAGKKVPSCQKLR